MENEQNTQVRFKLFESVSKPWATICQEAADFASGIPEERLISISHSQESIKGIVIVWYRS
ncbi:hypothetical protein [Aeoliella mucimassa]|uniref:Uncharacterized protein n=1 Tax=Aeoliella mucimassa TaxID=2527972 RepID=A0A518AIT6_9BACT|nr:hypothetical protein [Aeoliella mucimassa]QDU54610.1 hypothetical protein Pan181_07930 [Aeoliella mucimassa]